MDNHFNEDRRWRYNLEEGRMFTLSELIARREDANIDDYTIKKAEVDERVL